MKTAESENFTAREKEWFNSPVRAQLYEGDPADFPKPKRGITGSGIASSFGIIEDVRGFTMMNVKAMNQTVDHFQSSRKRYLPLLSSHDQRINSVLGLVTDLYVVPYEGLGFRFWAPNYDDEVNLYMKKIKDGLLRACSIGFEVIRQRTNVKLIDGYVGRILDEIRLLEISLVVFPADQNARIIALGDKKLQDETRYERNWRVVRQKVQYANRLSNGIDYENEIGDAD